MKWTRSAFFAVIQLFVCAIAFPATVTKLNDGVLSSLRRPAPTPRVVLDLPLYPRSTARVTLEEFQVWAPDGKVVIHDGDQVTTQDPPPMRFFRGEVANDPESFAYFSVELSTGKVTGLVATREGRFAVDGYRRVPAAGHVRDVSGDFVYMLTESNESDARDMTNLTWQCDVEDRTIPAQAAFKDIAQRVDDRGLPIQPEGITGAQTYSIRVEVETDFELYQNAGSNSTTLTNYVTNLTGAVSTIYHRDLKTDVLQQNVHVYTNSSDPWAATNSLDGLNELGDYYHAHYPGLARSAVVQLSGKDYGGGIAWEGLICFGDLLNGAHYAGPYAWCGGIGKLFGSTGLGTIPDPDATVGGVQFGMPSGTQNYWPLAEYAHELGHVMGGHHTHCVAITDAERIASGFTDGSPVGSASNFLDHCYGEEGDATCYGGTATTTSYVAGSQTVFKGTIMSYCHNVFVGSVPQSRFVFGLAAEPSHHELDDYMMRAAGPLAGGGNTNIVKATTATMSAITAPASVNASSTGNTASVTNVVGQTYAWTIAGGTITAGATTNSATFTAGASGNVVLRVAAYGANNCGVTDTKTVPIISGPPPPLITSLSITSGPTLGGTALVITGTGFVDGASVTFGGSMADVVFVNSTTLNVITPQRSTVGAVNVVVTNPDLQTGTKTNGFTYTLTPATATAVVPNVGPTGGGTAVTISGTLFFDPVSVLFGGSAGTSVTRVNSTTITCTTPAHAAGAVNVVVTNGDGGTATKTNGFTYQSLPPTVTSLNVITGPSTGGTAVTITGTNFVNPATVDFGGVAATSVNVASATSITCKTPAHAVGLVNVTVTTGGQSVTKTGAFTFDPVALPNGDVNGSGTLDGADVIYLANYLFGGGPVPVGSGDVNGDTEVNALDLFYLVNYLFASGEAPAP